MLEMTICDDDLNELSKTNKMCQIYKEKHEDADIRLRYFSSPTALQESIMQGERSDIYLLDIYMPNIMGTELAKLIRDKNENCQIIFLTTSTTHAVEAFSLRAAHYLVKPYTQIQLEDAISRALLDIEKRNKAKITVKALNGTCRIDFSNFIFSETNMHLQKIYLDDGKSHSVRMSSAELFKRLSSDARFFKCGSTYIINLSKVEEITKSFIQFNTGLIIPMQRRQYKDLVDRYTSYALEGI